ncbi:MAG: hypothetical protein FWB94_07725 [Chitinispirillia bacterium]|nr:hypothetical protein [Chitinispirillia bacterium]
MSSIVKKITPFIDRTLLLKALDAVGCKYTLQGNEILTDRNDYRGLQKFVFCDGKYQFLHDSDADLRSWVNINAKEYKTVGDFLKTVETQYNRILREQLEEEERIRIEAERKAFVEKQRQAIIENAKKQGYSVREERVKEKIKLVLVRTTY